MSTDYEYRPDGLYAGITKAGATKSFLWDGSNIIAEVSDGVLTAKYLRGIGLIARETSLGREYYTFNAHGDVVGLADSSGNVLKTYEYDAFGNEHEADPDDTNPFRYCGEYWDSYSKTYYLRNRHYNPSFGRFTSEDPARAGLNFYTYCDNNPVLFFDPLGLVPTTKEAALMADAIYLSNPARYELLGGWEFVRLLSKKDDNVRVGYFQRMLENGAYEYSVVNKGTAWYNGTDWGNNAAAYLTVSDDMISSVGYAKAFAEKYKDNEITFIGHSKGGGEAIANALSTGRDAITFNPAPVSTKAIDAAFGIAWKNRWMVQSNITNYVVKGDVLNNTFGNSTVGATVFLPQQYRGHWYQLFKFTTPEQPIQNHLMGAVFKAINEQGIGDNPGVMINTPTIG